MLFSLLLLHIDTISEDESWQKNLLTVNIIFGEVLIFFLIPELLNLSLTVYLKSLS